MKKFEIQVTQVWHEFGSVIIEAEDEDEAREWANEHLNQTDEFDWSGQDPQDIIIESVVEVE